MLSRSNSSLTAGFKAKLFIEVLAYFAYAVQKNDKGRASGKSFTNSFKLPFGVMLQKFTKSNPGILKV